MQTNLARILLFLIFVAVGAAAQEGDVDVDAAAAEQAAEIEALEPGVSSATLEEAGAGETDTATETAAAEPAAVVAQDIRRRQSSSGVMDEIDLERTEITGNQELPKVLYIVPWQKSQPGELSGKPVNSLLDEVLAPIDRSEFIRQVDYYGDLYAEEE
jgi:hypothetical protein